MYTLKGKIKVIKPVESGTSKAGKEWKKQTFVVSNNEGYEGKEQIFAFEVFGSEKVENLTKYHKEGNDVEVSFNISTNEWNGKYFTSLQSWKIQSLTTQEPAKVEEVEDDQDLPF